MGKNKYKKLKLSDLISVKHGYAFKGEYFSNQNNHVCLLTPGNFDIGGGFKENDKFYTGPIPKGYLLKYGDLVITMTDLSKNGDTLGYPAFIPKNQNQYLHNQRIGLVEFLSDEIDKYYLFYLLTKRKYQKYIVNTASGSTVRHTSPTKICSYEISLPPLSEQKRISSILSSFDNKIEQLKKENNILEDIAQNIFKEWFVKYNFPNKDGKPYKDNNGKMIDSELGEIPEGWRVCKLNEIIDLQGGFVHNTKITGESVSKIAKMGVVDGKSWFNENSVINYSEKIDPKYQLKEDDLLICTRDVTRDKIVIGNVAITPKHLADIGLYAGSNTWIVKTKINTYFLFFLFRDQKFRNHIINSSKGSTIVMITRDAFLSNSIVFPSEEFLSNLASKISPHVEKIKLNNLLLKKLTSIKEILSKEFFNNE